MRLWATLRDKDIMKMIIHLAWPTMLEQALQTFVSYADTAQVGAIGAQASAAVGVTGSMMWLVSAPMFAMAMGVLSVISRAIGAKDEETTQRAGSQSVILCILLGVVLGVITLAISPVLPIWLGASEEIRRDASIYFAIVSAPMIFRSSTIVFGSVIRATGDAKTPMINNLIMNLINIILNFFLIGPTKTYSFFGREISIFGANWGVTGAAIATATSFVVGGTLMFVTLMRNDTLKLKKQKLRLDQDIMERCVHIGMPIAAGRVSVSLGHVVFTSLIARLGTIPMAAHSIAITAEQAFYIPGYGMQTAAATLSGYAAGEKNERKLMQYSSAIVTLAVGLMLVLGVVLFVLAEPIMSIFTPDEEVIRLGAIVLRMVAISEPFYAAMVILEGVFNGVGHTRIPFFISTATMWITRILFSYICINFLGLGLTAVWGCMIADNVIKCILFVAHYIKGGWKKQLTFIPISE